MMRVLKVEIEACTSLEDGYGIARDCATGSWQGCFVGGTFRLAFDFSFFLSLLVNFSPLWTLSFRRCQRLGVKLTLLS